MVKLGGNATFGWSTAQVAVVLLGLNLLANYSRAAEFGLYDDDYLFTLPPMTWGLGEVVSNWWVSITMLPQGRPIWWIVNPTLAWGLGLLPTITWAYAFGLMLSTVTAVAVWRFLLRFSGPLAAFSGAAFFVLFPPDTSKAIIMHYVAFQFTTLLLVGALTLYLGGRQWTSYGLLAVILLTFEPYFLPFVLAPVLVKWTGAKDMLIRLVKHGAICTGIFVAVMLLRHFRGDARTQEAIADLGEVLFRVVTAPGIGMGAAMATMLTRPWEMLVTAGAIEWALMFVVAAGLFLVFRSESPILSSTGGRPASTGRGQFFLAGLLLAAIAYVYRFHDWYYPPTDVVGRISAIHQASAVGFALTFACGVDSLAWWTRESRAGTKALAAGLAIYFAALTGFFQRVQAVEYVRGWEVQLTFWEGILGGVGDLESDELVIVDLDSVHGQQGENARKAAEFRMHRLATTGDGLSDFAEVPPGWTGSGSMRGYYKRAPVMVDKEGVRFGVESELENQPVIENGKFLLFRFDGSAWVRSSERIVIGGQMRVPKSPSVETTNWVQRTEIYHRIFDPDAERREISELVEKQKTMAEKRERKATRASAKKAAAMESKAERKKPTQVGRPAN